MVFSDVGNRCLNLDSLSLCNNVYLSLILLPAVVYQLIINLFTTPFSLLDHDCACVSGKPGTNRSRVDKTWKWIKNDLPKCSIDPSALHGTVFFNTLAIIAHWNQLGHSENKFLPKTLTPFLYLPFQSLSIHPGRMHHTRWFNSFCLELMNPFNCLLS